MCKHCNISICFVILPLKFALCSKKQQINLHIGGRCANIPLFPPVDTCYWCDTGLISERHQWVHHQFTFLDIFALKKRNVYLRLLRWWFSYKWSVNMSGLKSPQSPVSMNPSPFSVCWTNSSTSSCVAIQTAWTGISLLDVFLPEKGS